MSSYFSETNKRPFALGGGQDGPARSLPLAPGANKRGWVIDRPALPPGVRKNLKPYVPNIEDLDDEQVIERLREAGWAGFDAMLAAMPGETKRRFVQPEAPPDWLSPWDYKKWLDEQKKERFLRYLRAREEGDTEYLETRQPRPGEMLPLSEEQRALRREKLQEAWAVMSPLGDPSTEAKIRAYADRFGIEDHELLRNNLDKFEEEILFSDMVELTKRDDWFQEFLENPHNLLVAKDNLKDLARFGSLIYTKEGPWYGQLFDRTVMQLRDLNMRGMAGIAQLFKDFGLTGSLALDTMYNQPAWLSGPGWDPMRDDLFGTQYEVRVGDVEGAWGFALDALGGMSQALTFAGMSVINPGLAMGTMTAQYGGPKYMSYRKAGFDPFIALPVALAEGALIAKIEKMQLGAFKKGQAALKTLFKTGSARRAFSGVVGSSVRGGFEEFAQGIVDKTGTGLLKGLDGQFETRTELWDFVKESIDESLYEGLIGLTLPLPFVGRTAIGELVNYKRSVLQHSAIESGIEAAADSKIKSIDPEVASRAVDAATAVASRAGVPLKTNVNGKDLGAEFQEDPEFLYEFLESQGYSREHAKKFIEKAEDISVDLVKVFKQATPETKEKLLRASKHFGDEGMDTVAGAEKQKKFLVDLQQAFHSEHAELMSQEPMTREQRREVAKSLGAFRRNLKKIFGFTSYDADAVIQIIRAVYRRVAVAKGVTSADVVRDMPLEVVFTPDGAEFIEAFDAEAGPEKKERAKTAKAATVFRDGKVTMGFFKKHDKTALLQELGRFFGHVLDDLSKPDTGYGEEYSALLEKVKQRGIDLSTEKGRTRFALAFQHYMLKGTAPTVELTQVFKDVRQWALDSYNQARLKYEVPDDVADLFDAMLATEAQMEVAVAQEIEATEKRIDDRFDSLIEEDVEKRREANARRRELERTKDARLAQKKVKIARRLYERFVKEHGHRRKFLDEAKQEISGSKPYQVLARFTETRSGTKAAPRAISRSAIETAFRETGIGIEEVVEDLKRHNIYRERSGLTYPEVLEIAEEFDFSSVKDMINMLRNLQPLKAVAKKAQRQKLQEVYDQILSLEQKDEGAFDDPAYDEVTTSWLLYKIEAREQALDQAKARKKSWAEWKKLKAKAKVELETQAGHEAHEHGRIVARMQRYHKAAIDAENIADMQKWNDLFLFQYALAIESRRLLKEYQQGLNQIKNMPAKKVSGEYAEVIRLLKKFYIDNEKVDYARLPLPEDFMPEFKEGGTEGDLKQLVGGEEASAPEWIRQLEKVSEYKLTDAQRERHQKGELDTTELERLKYKSSKDMSPVRFRQLLAFLHFLQNRGRQQFESSEMRRFGSVTEVKQRVLDTLRSRKTSRRWTDEKGKTIKGGLAKFFQQAFAPARMLTFVMEKAGLTDIYDALKTAELKNRQAVEAMAADIKPILATLETARKRVFGRKRRVTVTDEFGKPVRLPEAYAKAYEMSRDGWGFDEVLAVLIHWGHTGGRYSLSFTGADSDDATLKANAYGLTQRDVNALAALFDAKELEAIQSYIDVLGKGFEDVRAVKYRMHNVLVPEVEAEPYEVKDRNGKTFTFRGGYAPLNYDKRVNREFASRVDESAGNYMQAALDSNTTAHYAAHISEGHVKERRPNVNLSPRLDMEGFTEYLAWKAKYVTSAEVVRDAWRVITDQDVREMIQKKLGKEQYQILRNAVHTRAGTKIAPEGWWFRAFRAAARTFGVATLTYRLYTSTKQVFSVPAGVEYMMRHGKGGLKHYTTALLSMTNPEVVAQIPKMSRQVAQRSKTMTIYLSDFEREMARPVGSRGLRKFARQTKALNAKVGWSFIRAADSLAVYPLWYASYTQAMSGDVAGVDTTGLSSTELHDAAVRYADRVISSSQPSGLDVDRSELQQRWHYLQPMFIFTGWVGKKANILVERLEDFLQGRGFKEKSLRAAGGMTSYIHLVVVPALAFSLIRTLRDKAFSDDDDETFWDKLKYEMISNTVSGVPGVQQAVDSIMYGGDIFTIAGDDLLKAPIATGKRLSSGDYYQASYELLNLITAVMGGSPLNLGGKPLRDFMKELDR